MGHPTGVHESAQHDLAELFGHLTGDTSDKFARCEWDTDQSGAPLLQHCAAWMEGSIVASYDVGDVSPSSWLRLVAGQHQRRANWLPRR